jgi:hypothetical protein
MAFLRKLILGTLPLLSFSLPNCLFSYFFRYPIQKDEQDIEILTGHYTNYTAGIPAGLELTNWAAHPVNETMPGRMVRGRQRVVRYRAE